MKELILWHKFSLFSGVTIGKNCILEAYNLVNKNIPDNSLAYGTPVKVITKLDFKK